MDAQSAVTTSSSGAKYPQNESGYEEACSKIWTIYTAEAEKHDKALMESWARDMKGVLLFAALFSAILTTFIVESYQTLKPEPSDKIIALLTTISGHMSNSNASATFPDIQAVSFAPTTSSILCNVLWFLSLSLSLTCALLATLVEQWARGYTQKIDHSVLPGIRAKISSYLYSGMKAFDMHTLVELIPLLLHSSLIMFFAGLVAFLMPIHLVLVAITATWTALLVISYTILTALPLFRPDSPYWTPLSGIIWRLLKISERVFSRTGNGSRDSGRHESAVGRMVDHLVNQVAKPSEANEFRDVHALCWTVRTLTDGRRLEVLIDGIYDAIWSSQGRRHSHEHLVMGLLQDSDTRLIARIQQFLTSSTSDLLHPSAATRRQITCLKAIWAMATIFDEGAVISNAISSFDSSLLVSSPLVGNPGLANYLPSVRAVVMWNLFRSFCKQTENMRTMMKRGDKMLSTRDALRREVHSIAQKIRQLSLYVYSQRGKDLQVLAKIEFHPTWTQDVLAILDECQEWLNDIPHHIFLRFLAESANVAAPYEFNSTCNMIIGYGGRPRLGSVAPIAVKRSFETLFTELIAANIEILRHTASVHHIDIALGHLLSISHRDSYHSKYFTKLLVIYLTQRNCTAALFCLLENYTVNLLWPRIAVRLNKRAPEFEDAYVMAIWELASLGPRYAQETQKSRPEYDVRFEFWVLDALNENTAAYASTTVLVKLNILSWIYRRHFEGPLVVDGLLQHPLIRATGIMKEDKIGLSPLDMGKDVEEENLKLFRAACAEAHFTALTAFLQACSSSMMPYKAAETLSCIAFPDFPRGENVPRNAQIHFAKSVQRVVRSQLREDQLNHLLVSPLVAMLNRNIRNVLTDLSASCTVTDAILEAEQESLGSANVNWDQLSDVTNSEGTRSRTG